jgi:hypothetical protein
MEKLMKIQWSFKKSIALAATLAIVSGTAFATCRPNNCAQLRDECFDSGGKRCDDQGIGQPCMRRHS